MRPRRAALAIAALAQLAERQHRPRLHAGGAVLVAGFAGYSSCFGTGGEDGDR